MAENIQNSDEIDLGQLFQLVRRGLHSLFRGFLKAFVFLKRNALILIGLAFAGGVLGYGLNQIVSKRLKTEVILKPTLESKEYLYDVVDEIQANIRGKEHGFFSELGIDLMEMKGLEVAIEPMAQSRNSMIEDELEYLELLGKFQDQSMINDVVKSEILNKTSLNHRLIIYYKDKEKGEQAVIRLVTYINSNPYLNEIVGVQLENAQKRIKENDQIIEQVDGLLTAISKSMSGQNQVEDRIVLQSERENEISELLLLKNNLLRDNERKRVELTEKEKAITVLNLGKPHEVTKSIFGKRIVLIPILLISLFLLVKFVGYMNGKANEYGL